MFFYLQVNDFNMYAFNKVLIFWGLRTQKPTDGSAPRPRWGTSVPQTS